MPRQVARDAAAQEAARQIRAEAERRAWAAAYAWRARRGQVVTRESVAWEADLLTDPLGAGARPQDCWNCGKQTFPQPGFFWWYCASCAVGWGPPERDPRRRRTSWSDTSVSGKTVLVPYLDHSAVHQPCPA